MKIPDGNLRERWEGLRLWVETYYMRRYPQAQVHSTDTPGRRDPRQRGTPKTTTHLSIASIQSPKSTVSTHPHPTWTQLKM